MILFYHLMQGSLVLPHRLPQPSLAFVQSVRSFTPELVGAFHVSPLQSGCTCKFSSRSIEFPKDADSVNELCLSSRVEARGVSSKEGGGTGRMRSNSWASVPSCFHSRPLVPSAFHRSVAIHGQTLDYSSWKSLVSGHPGPSRHNLGQPWYCIPSRALSGLKTTHYGPIAGKKSGQDLLVRDSDKGTRSKKGLISALSRSEEGTGNVKEKEKVFDEVVTLFHEEDSDSESDDDLQNIKKKHKKEKRLKGMQEEEEDSESDSDDEEEKHKMKKSMGKEKVEVVGVSEYDEMMKDESDSDEEKEMKKKIKAEKKELKKQAKKKKKETKAMEKMASKDENNGGEDENKIKAKKMVQAVYHDEYFNQQNHSLGAPDSSSGSELGGEDDDAVDVVFELGGEDDDVVDVVLDALDKDEYEDEEFELVEDEDLGDEIEREIEDAFEEFEDEELDERFWEEEEEEGEAMVGDGGDGGGVVLGDSQWGKKALELAEVVVKELGTEFAIYAFKASPDGFVRVRLDNVSDQYGSPTMSEIETFTRKFRAILDSTELIPDEVAVEVSSPGAERMVKIPDELERFNQLPMYVQYVEDETGNLERDGVLELESLDSESGMTVWKLANVRFNRDQSGKGRPLNSKQKKWRAHVPLDSLKLVRLYLDV